MSSVDETKPFLVALGEVLLSWNLIVSSWAGLVIEISSVGGTMRKQSVFCWLETIVRME